ncbi:MAG: hypothetical protein CML24_14685 [Rhizobiales bacterium]|nr:hypothetical protein [Hyphomicrobiales bacterium]|tara:strand:- start:8357 stop:8755 length:399 start_codon:yes stop_codon:yes gene_type:complete
MSNKSVADATLSDQFGIDKERGRIEIHFDTNEGQTLLSIDRTEVLQIIAFLTQAAGVLEPRGKLADIMPPAFPSDWYEVRSTQEGRVVLSLRLEGAGYIDFAMDQSMAMRMMETLQGQLGPSSAAERGPLNG